jgi:hypothetical protein
VADEKDRIVALRHARRTSENSPRRENFGSEPRQARSAGEVSPNALPSLVMPSWLESSFDLAQGLDVSEVQSKLSAQTLDRLFKQ